MPNDIRQDKTHKFNFTLADGSTKTITHDVPLPVASEIGCVGKTDSKEEVFNLTGLTARGDSEISQGVPVKDGYLFDISKIEYYSIAITSNAPSVIITIDKDNTDENTVWLKIKNTGAFTKVIDATLNAYIYKLITNVQENLDYLYSEKNVANDKIEYILANIDKINNQIFVQSVFTGEKTFEKSQGSGQSTMIFRLKLLNENYQWSAGKDSINVTEIRFFEGLSMIEFDWGNQDYGIDSENNWYIKINKRSGESFDTNTKYYIRVPNIQLARTSIGIYDTLQICWQDIEKPSTFVEIT